MTLLLYVRQVPKEYLDRFAFVRDDEPRCRAQTARVYPGAAPGAYSCRRQYRAMVNLLDDVVARLEDKLRARGMSVSWSWPRLFIRGILCAHP